MGNINKCKMYLGGMTLSCRPCPHTANCNCGETEYDCCSVCGGGLIGSKAESSGICMACNPTHSKPVYTVQIVDEIVDQISEGYGNTPTIVVHAAAILKSYLIGTPEKPMDTETSNMAAWLKRTEN